MEDCINYDNGYCAEFDDWVECEYCNKNCRAYEEE